ncbi:MAG: hypothetical protein GF330_00715 [Candidatus Eisenbacteria bacterium]|nr:hypothetical protein [Candidatus Eisenbacteria bacterium]
MHRRRQQAARRMRALAKRGVEIQPVSIRGRAITRTFWGNAWCDHLESFSDYANRLPRGRTYVRNGSVCHLEMRPGVVSAWVSGSTLYRVNIGIRKLPKRKWASLKSRCGGEIGSLLELLEGRFSDAVMEVVTDRETGLFPNPLEITLDCDCPDWALMCKHVAAVLYGVGARLDERPELLFVLRGVNHEELITESVGHIGRHASRDRDAGAGSGGGRRLTTERISDVFGIELEAGESPVQSKRGAGAEAKAKRGVRRKVARGQSSRTRRTGTRREKSKTRGPVRRSRSSGRPTGRTVAELRRRFAMTRVEFAALLQVSPATVALWERSRGKLRMRTRSLAAWQAAARLTPVGASRKVKRLAKT